MRLGLGKRGVSRASDSPVEWEEGKDLTSFETSTNFIDPGSERAGGEGAREEDWIRVHSIGSRAKTFLLTKYHQKSSSAACSPRLA